MVTNQKWAKKVGLYEPTPEYKKYIQGAKECWFGRDNMPSTVAYIEEEGYPPHTLKVYSGEYVYAFQPMFIDYHSPMGTVEIIDGESMSHVCPCICDKEGGIYINFPTLTMVWQHRVFALCLEERKKTGGTGQWQCIMQVTHRPSHITTQTQKPQRVVDTHYAIVATDGSEYIHNEYTIQAPIHCCGPRNARL